MEQLARSFKERMRKNAPLHEYTTWKVGGMADYLVIADTYDDLLNVLDHAGTLHLPWMVLGNGSNVLFSDEGYHGVIIQLGHNFQKKEVDGTRIMAGGGYSLQKLANDAASESLSGLEPLAGIPGTCGAAAVLNAGAFGKNFLDLVIEIENLDAHKTLSVTRGLQSEYRRSNLSRDLIITKVTLQLSPGNPSDISIQMNQYLDRRRKTQPITEYSAGCTFKNPKGAATGRLIDQLGMKGYRVGNAKISEKHANFIINMGGATALEIMELIRVVRQRVFQSHGIKLDLEVEIFDSSGKKLDPGGV